MNLDLVLIATGLFSIIFAISAHEMMHAWVSDWLGDDTASSMGRRTLNPLSHIDPITTVALPLVMLIFGWPPIGAARPVQVSSEKLRFREYGLALVAIAGPLTNFVLAIIGGMVYHQVAPGSFLSDLSQVFIAVNVGFFVFNLLPIPPLDGSRVVYAIAPDFIRSLMDTIESFGLFFTLFLLIFLFSYLEPLLRAANRLVFNLIF